MDTAMIERLTAHATPNPLPLEGDEQREQRNWVVRFTVDLPSSWRADTASAELTQEAASAVRNALRERGLQEREAVIPSINVLALDGRHVIVSVRTIRLEHDEAHAWLVAASAALTALDRAATIDDLQGIPRRFWRLVVGP